MGEASCPKVTIVVPVYNSARSIQRCLDSLLAQSERSIRLSASTTVRLMIR